MPEWKPHDRVRVRDTFITYPEKYQGKLGQVWPVNIPKGHEGKVAVVFDGDPGLYVLIDPFALEAADAPIPSPWSSESNG